MQPIVFENEAKTQKIIVILSTSWGDKVQDNDEFEVNVQFEPSFGEQDKQSLHYMAATHLISSLKASW